MFVKSILADEIEKLPKAVFPGSIEVIDEKDALYREAIECLSSSDVIGFDTESRPTFSPNQPPYGISLLQRTGFCSPEFSCSPRAFESWR